MKKLNNPSAMSLPEQDDSVLVCFMEGDEEKRKSKIRRVLFHVP